MVADAGLQTPRREAASLGSSLSCAGQGAGILRIVVGGAVAVSEIPMSREGEFLALANRSDAKYRIGNVRGRAQRPIKYNKADAQMEKIISDVPWGPLKELDGTLLEC